jgi:plasmid replication initiation protein
MAYPFFSLAKSRRIRPIKFASGNVEIRVEAVPAHGMATIWDADILIWVASQIAEARDAGLRTSRLMAATPYQTPSSSMFCSVGDVVPIQPAPS